MTIISNPWVFPVEFSHPPTQKRTVALPAKEKLGPHLSSRGLYPGIMTHMTAGDLKGCSPEALLQNKETVGHGTV